MLFYKWPPPPRRSEANKEGVLPKGVVRVGREGGKRSSVCPLEGGGAKKVFPPPNSLFFSAVDIGLCKLGRQTRDTTCGVGRAGGGETGTERKAENISFSRLLCCATLDFSHICSPFLFLLRLFSGESSLFSRCITHLQG